jgi:trk system potassium uptake protein TrkH
MLNFRIIFKVMGLLLAVEAVAMLIALLVAVIYGGPDITSFAYSAGITVIAGLISFLIGRTCKEQIGKREGYITVSLVWIIFSLFGALPYVIGGFIPTYTDAFFETMSGFTTTGSSILNDIEALPKGILFWRSITQWLGGMGIIVLSLAILPILGIGGMQLFVAEVPGPTPDKLHPRIRQTAKNLWGIYVLLTLLETILLVIGDMSFFDAICHSFTTMATGGYSTKQASIAFFDSAYIQYVIIVFMILAGTNFTLSYLALKGKIGRAVKNEEFKWYILFIAIFTVIITIGLNINTNTGYEENFRSALFQVVSIITTTGYATADYLMWAPVLSVLIFTLFFFGGSAGSTGGGIKIVRILLLLKNSWQELRRLIHPNAVIPVRFNQRSVSDQIILNVLAFFMIYMLVFFVSVVIYSFSEPDLPSAMGAVATSLGNIGPGLGNVGPAENFSHISTFGKWFLSFLMLLGRLELFTVLVLFTPSFWKR